jgi:hypothetical protein
MLRARFVVTFGDRHGEVVDQLNEPELIADFWPLSLAGSFRLCSANCVAGGASKSASTELNRMAQFPGRA